MIDESPALVAGFFLSGIAAPHPRQFADSPGPAGGRLWAGRMSLCRVELSRFSETHWKSIVIDAARRNMKRAAFKAREGESHLETSGWGTWISNQD